MIEVLEPGLLTTVQDRGRPGLGHLGVPVAGAADPWSHAIANVLAGNPPGAAALEITATGPRLRASVDVRLALAGADLRATIDGAPLAPGRAATLRAGQELAIPGPPSRGLRAYVAFCGGIDVPAVLGSRATCLNGGFGGLEGRSLQVGDRLALGLASVPADAEPGDAWPGPPTAPRTVNPGGTTVLRYIAGPAARAQQLTGPWRVSPASDRMGIRLESLDAHAASSADSIGAGLPSHGVVPGTIQLPPDGRPIVLGVDHQTTGGYPIAGVVISADLAALGQLAPGDRVGLEQVHPDAARRALGEQRSEWERALRILRGDAGWDELWRTAGA